MDQVDIMDQREGRTTAVLTGGVKAMDIETMDMANPRNVPGGTAPLTKYRRGLVTKMPSGEEKETGKYAACIAEKALRTIHVPTIGSKRM